MLVFEQMLDATLSRRRAEDMGQYSLFGGEDASVAEAPVGIPPDEWDKKLRLAFEKEMLGLYVSDHPLLGVEGVLRSMCSSTVLGLWELKDRTTVTVAGIVGPVTRRFTRAEEPILYFALEDLEAGVEVLCFPKTVAEYGPFVREDAIVVITGRLDHRGDDVKLLAESIREPRLDREQAVRLRVAASRLSRSMVDRLRSALGNHPGGAAVYLHMTGEADAEEKVVRLGDDYRVEPRSALFAELRELFGPSAVL
jgi:DNA polymerase-3 subunit alpha